jgi:hypothetical protein
MSSQQRRSERAEHLEDEGRAIALQQASAGATHSPVEWALPATPDTLAIAIRAAVAAERERCARLAETFATAPAAEAHLPGADAQQLAVAQATALRIASALRAATD